MNESGSQFASTRRVPIDFVRVPCVINDEPIPQAKLVPRTQNRSGLDCKNKNVHGWTGSLDVCLEATSCEGSNSSHIDPRWIKLVTHRVEIDNVRHVRQSASHDFDHLTKMFSKSIHKIIKLNPKTMSDYKFQPQEPETRLSLIIHVFT